jgi:hypothetical protein
VFEFFPRLCEGLSLEETHSHEELYGENWAGDELVEEDLLADRGRRPPGKVAVKVTVEIVVRRTLKQPYQSYALCGDSL